MPSLVMLDAGALALVVSAIIVVLIGVEALIMALIGGEILHQVVDQRQRGRRAWWTFMSWLALAVATVALEMTGHLLVIVMGMLVWFVLLVVAFLVAVMRIPADRR